jgi:hypothetical protein
MDKTERILFVQAVLLPAVFVASCTATALKASDVQPAVGRESWKESNQKVASSRSPTYAQTDLVERKRTLDVVRKCVDKPPINSLGIHGTPLDFSRAVIETPADVRARGEGGSLASQGKEYRIVWIPESPSMNDRVPNGLHIIVNIEIGECEFPKMR